MIRLASPQFRPQVLTEVGEILRSGNLVQGERVQRFESAAAKYLNVSNVVAVSNGTIALELSLRALGIGPGSRVLVPAYSFVASANVVHMLGAEPVFVDVCSSDLTMDPQLLESALDEFGGDAVLPVHEFGFPASVLAMPKRIEGRSLSYVEDAACALGTISDPPVGRHSTLWCYSLHPRKVLTSGEGGLICTDDDKLAGRLRLMRNHGLTRIGDEIDCLEPGTNARMTEIQAALALDQLDSLEEALNRRGAIAKRYLEELKDLPIVLPTHNEDVDRPNWQSFFIRFADNAVRREIAERLLTAKVECSVGAQCIPAMSWYSARRDAREPSISYPVAWNAWKTGMVIPLHEALLDDEVSRVIRVLRTVEGLS